MQFNFGNNDNKVVPPLNLITKMSKNLRITANKNLKETKGDDEALLNLALKM